MEKTIEKLKGHTYLSKTGKEVKNPKIDYKQVVEAYTYLIKSLNGKVSQRVLRLAFTDKAKAFTQILLDDGFISKVKECNIINIRFENGSSKYVSTPITFASDNKVSKKTIKNNKYISALFNKIQTKPEYTKLTNIIKDTLSRTTLDGKHLGGELKYNKGRYYGAHTTMPKETRKRILIDGEKTHSYDIKSAIFQLLSKNKIKGITPLAMTTGFYEEMKEKYNLSKKEVLKQVFNHPAQQNVLLDEIPFFSSIKRFKYKYGYKFAYKIYQECEIHIMNDIYQYLSTMEIDFLPMHDSVIFKQSDKERVLDLISSITTIEFKLEY